MKRIISILPTNQITKIMANKEMQSPHAIMGIADFETRQITLMLEDLKTYSHPFSRFEGYKKGKIKPVFNKFKIEEWGHGFSLGKYYDEGVDTFVIEALFNKANNTYQQYKWMKGYELRHFFVFKGEDHQIKQRTDRTNYQTGGNNG